MSENKKSTRKAAVAAVVGVLLLSGVGGSFAKWYDNQQVGSGTVTAGNLSLNVQTGSAWYDLHDPTVTTDDTAITDISTFRMVPGDTIEYRAVVKPKLVGNNLKADLAADVSTASGTMVTWATVTSTLTTSTGGAVTMPLTPTTADGAISYNATVRITMPFSTGDTNGTDGEDTVLNLSSLKLSLVQTANP